MPVPLTPDLCAEYFLRHLDEPLGAHPLDCPIFSVLSHAMPDASVEVDYEKIEVWEMGDNGEFVTEIPMPGWATRLARAADNDFDSWFLITGRIALGMLDAATGVVGATNGGAQ